MTIALTTPIAIPNVQRWAVANVSIDDNNSVMLADVNLLTSAGTGQVAARARVAIYNFATGGLSTSISVVTPLSGSDVTSILSFSTLSLATGYTDAVTAWRGGATSAARKTALEAFLLSSGICGAGLAGS